MRKSGNLWSQEDQIQISALTLCRATSGGNIRKPQFICKMGTITTTEDNVSSALNTVPGKTQVLKKFCGINE